jgi:hypothetical protein
MDATGQQIFEVPHFNFDQKKSFELVTNKDSQHHNHMQP